MGMLGIGLERLFGVGLGLSVGSYCYAKTAQLPSGAVLSGANNKFRTFFTQPRDEPPSDATAEFEAQWNMEVEGSVAGEAVQGESVRVEDVWLVQPGEVGQGLQQIEQRGLQPHIVLSQQQQQQQQFVQPLQDDTVSSTT